MQDYPPLTRFQLAMQRMPKAGSFAVGDMVNVQITSGSGTLQAKLGVCSSHGSMPAHSPALPRQGNDLPERIEPYPGTIDSAPSQPESGKKRKKGGKTKDAKAADASSPQVLEIPPSAFLQAFLLRDAMLVSKGKTPPLATRSGLKPISVILKDYQDHAFKGDDQVEGECFSKGLKAVFGHVLQAAMLHESEVAAHRDEILAREKDKDKRTKPPQKARRKAGDTAEADLGSNPAGLYGAELLLRFLHKLPWIMSRFSTQQGGILVDPGWATQLQTHLQGLTQYIADKADELLAADYVSSEEATGPAE
eukprot:gene2252-3124_t